MITKITKEFSEEDDLGKAKLFLQSEDLYWALNDVAEELRTLLKWNDTLDDKQIEIVEKIRQKFYEILCSRGIDLNTLC